MHTWMRVAEIVKAKTLQGGLVVRSSAGLPFLLQEGMGVSFVPPQFDCPRSAVVVSVAPSLKNNNHLVHFDTVTTREVAEKLAGCSCLVKRDDIDPEALIQDEQPLLGYRVIDEVEDELGVVYEVEENPWQTLLVVKGENGLLSIPYVEEFILEENAEERIIRTKIPVGLLGLSRSEPMENGGQ